MRSLILALLLVAGANAAEPVKGARQKAAALRAEAAAHLRMGAQYERNPVATGRNGAFHPSHCRQLADKLNEQAVRVERKAASLER